MITLYEDDSLFSQVDADWMVGVGVKVPILSRDGRSGKVEAARVHSCKPVTQGANSARLESVTGPKLSPIVQAEEEVTALDTSLELATETCACKIGL